MHSSHEVMTRGDLPHWYKPGHAHFVTYRIVDSIPAEKLVQWREHRQRLLDDDPPPGISVWEHQERAHKRFFAEYDRFLDTNCQQRWLADAQVAAMIRENLYHHDGAKYHLMAWCIMSNHVQVLLQPLEWNAVDLSASSDATSHVGQAASLPNHPSASLPTRFQGSVVSDEVADRNSPLSKIMHSLKSYTANQANRILGRTGQFWQHESYDHWVRDLYELERIIAYILPNPVTAKLCRRPCDWQYSSAYDRFQRDGSECGLVGRLRNDWRK